MRTEIILLFGGESDERLVSVASAQAMAEQINCHKIWYLNPKLEVFALSSTELLAHQNPFTHEFIPNSQPLFSTLNQAISSQDSKNCVFLLALHGGMGEDGTLQAMLEQGGRHFTGSDSTSSKQAFNKLATKKALANQGIKLAPHIIFENPEQLRIFMIEHKNLVLKPVSGGSSLGCYFVKTQEQFDYAIEQLKNSQISYFAESMILGRELTVGVIESKNGLIALPATEIVTNQSRNFDYEGKYLGLGSQEITPAHISIELLKAAQNLALKAHHILGLSGYSRTDMIATDSGLYFLEINTLPGLSKKSLVPQQLAAAGISFAQFLRDQVDLANSK